MAILRTVLTFANKRRTLLAIARQRTGSSVYVFCQKCGQGVQESANFCANCGSAIVEKSDVARVATTPNKSGKANYSAIWVLVTILFLYFAIAFAGGIYMGQQVRQQGGELASAGIALFGIDNAAAFVQHNAQAQGGFTGFLALSPTFKWGLEVGGSMTGNSQ